MAGRAGEGPAAPAGVVTGPLAGAGVRTGTGGSRGPGRDSLEGPLARSPLVTPLSSGSAELAEPAVLPLPGPAWGPGEARSLPGR